MSDADTRRIDLERADARRKAFEDIINRLNQDGVSPAYRWAYNRAIKKIKELLKS